MKRSKKNILHTIYGIVTVAVLMVVVFRNYLAEPWLASDVTWENVVYAVTTDEGIMAILDDGGYRITITDANGHVENIIDADYDDGDLPTQISGMALDDNYLYLAESSLSTNGIRATETNISKYTFDGRRVATLMHSDAQEPESHVDNMVATGDSLFVLRNTGHAVQMSVFVDTLCVRRDTISIQGKQIFRARYNQLTQTTDILTIDGCQYTYHDGVTLDYSDALGDNDVCVFDVDRKGQLRYIDQNHHELRKITAPKPETLSAAQSASEKRDTLDDAHEMIRSLNMAAQKPATLLHTNAESLCNTIWHGRQYVCLAGASLESVNLVSLDDDSMTTISSAPYSTQHLALRYATILSLLVLIVALLWLLAVGAYKLVNGIRHAEERHRMVSDDAPIGIYDLYCSKGLYIILGFLICGVTVFSMYFNKEVELRKQYMQSVASYISSVSEESGMGEHILNIHDAEDSDSKDYGELESFVRKTCMTDRNADNFFEIGYAVVTLTHGGVPLNIISHQTSFNGHMLPLSSYGKHFDALRQGDVMQRVRQGETVSTTIRSDTQYQEVTLAPLYCRGHRLVGIVILNIDMWAVISGTLYEMIPTVIKLVTLIFLIIMLIGEVRITIGFLRIRSRRIKESGTRNFTTCEGHRTLRIMNNLTYYMILPLLPALLPTLVEEGGTTLDAAMLIALPLSARGLMVVLPSLFTGIYTKRNPRAYQFWGGGSRVVIYSMCIVAVWLHSYWIFLVAMILQGVSCAICSTSARSIRIVDTKPHPRYSKLVYTSMEETVASAIGVPLGVFIFDNFGIVAAFAAAAVISLLHPLFAVLFIGSDINVTEPAKATQTAAVRERMNEFLTYLLRKDMIAAVVFALLPIGCLPFFVAYLLPLYNAYQGNPVVVVGLLTMFLSMTSFLAAPEVFTRLVDRGGNIYSIKVGLALMSLAFLFFAVEQTMLSFSLMLFVTGIFFIVMTTNIERIQIAAAKEQHIELNNYYGVFAAITSSGGIISPLLLGMLAGVGYSFLGFVWAAIMAICFIAYIMLNRKRVKN